jgi:hypothetical protein
LSVTAAEGCGGGVFFEQETAVTANAATRTAGRQNDWAVLVFMVVVRTNGAMDRRNTRYPSGHAHNGKTECLKRIR